MSSLKPNGSMGEAFLNPSTSCCRWTIPSDESSTTQKSTKETVLHPDRDQSPLLSPEMQISIPYAFTESSWKSKAPLLPKREEILTNHSFPSQSSDQVFLPSHEYEKRRSTGSAMAPPHRSIKSDDRCLHSSSLLHRNRRGEEREADRIKSIPLSRRTPLILNTMTVSDSSRSPMIQCSDPYSIQSRTPHHETHPGTISKGSFQSLGSHIPQFYIERH